MASYNHEFTTCIAPSRMFQAMIVDSHNLLPQVAPHGIKSIHFEKGDGGVGSIKVTKFAKGGQYTYLKHRIDCIDMQNLSCTYTLIEGDGIYAQTTSIVYEVKFEAWGNGGCRVMMNNPCPKMEYYQHVEKHLLMYTHLYC